MQPTPDVLDRLLVNEVSRQWHASNQTLFDGRLRPPLLELTDTTSNLGRWQRVTRTLALSRPLIRERPWGMVLEVLKHEMAHQYVDEVLGVHHESPHGAAFREVCEERGIDPRAYGLPEDHPADDDATRILRRVHKLLALATSANAHEAESAMKQAQRLMLEHNLHAAPTPPQGYRFLRVGTPTERVPAHEKILGGILTKYFFVRAILVPHFDATTGKTGTVMELCGRPENLAMADYVYAFVHRTAQHLWQEHKRTHGIRADRDRRTFLVGVMSGLAEKLESEREQQQQHGLVWVGDAQLEDLHERRFPSRRSSAVYARQGDAMHHGRHAGRSITISRPLEEGGESRGRMLGPGTR